MDNSHSDIPDGILASAWTKEIQARYQISQKPFYQLRAARQVTATVSSGRPSKIAKIGSGSKAVKSALGSGSISQSTAQRCNRLLTKTAVRSAGSSKEATMASNLCTLFYVGRNMLDSFLCSFMLTLGIAREFARLGVDPTKQVLSWTSEKFSVSIFRSVLSKSNAILSQCPSIYKAVSHLFNCKEINEGQAYNKRGI